MMKLSKLFVRTLLLMGAISPLWAESFSELHTMGYVVVSLQGPQDGGDFGPLTSGTKTAGIQEALNYVKSLQKGPHSEKNIYICRGNYQTSETVKIPWVGERFRMEAPDVWIDYTGTTGDAFVFDSQMNCRFNFGYLSARRSMDGWVVRLKPQDPDVSPDKDVAVITCTIFNINAIVVKGIYRPEGDLPKGDLQGINVWTGKGKRGNGVLFDASGGPIIWNEMNISELNTAETGFSMKGNCGSNWIKVGFAHGCDTHLVVGEPAAAMQPYDNRIVMSISSDGVPESIGARIFASRNIFDMTVFGTAAGKNLIFEPDAKNNIVYATQLPNGITNNAKYPNNKIIFCSDLALEVQTPPLPSTGQELQNQNPYTIEVTILNPGEVSQWSKTDVAGKSQTINAPLFAGQNIILNPGDKIRLDYTQPPAWDWKVLR